MIMLDRIAAEVRERLEDPSLELVQVLEAGTWKAGREKARELRPDTGGPPIRIVLDGTVF